MYILLMVVLSAEITIKLCMLYTNTTVVCYIMGIHKKTPPKLIIDLLKRLQKPAESYAYVYKIYKCVSAIEIRLSSKRSEPEGFLPPLSESSDSS